MSISSTNSVPIVKAPKGQLLEPNVKTSKSFIRTLPVGKDIRALPIVNGDTIQGLASLNDEQFQQIMALPDAKFGRLVHGAQARLKKDPGDYISLKVSKVDSRTGEIQKGYKVQDIQVKDLLSMFGNINTNDNILRTIRQKAYSPENLLEAMSGNKLPSGSSMFKDFVKGKVAAYEASQVNNPDDSVDNDEADNEDPALNLNPVNDNDKDQEIEGLKDDNARLTEERAEMKRKLDDAVALLKVKQAELDKAKGENDTRVNAFMAKMENEPGPRNHVVTTLGTSYDKLESFLKEKPKAGQESNLDKAEAVYQQFIDESLVKKPTKKPEQDPEELTTGEPPNPDMEIIRAGLQDSGVGKKEGINKNKAKTYLELANY